MSKNFSNISLEHTRKTPNQQFMFGNFLLYLRGGWGYLEYATQGYVGVLLEDGSTLVNRPDYRWNNIQEGVMGSALGAKERIFENTWAVGKTLVLYCKKGDEILPSDIGIIVSQYRDPVINQPGWLKSKAWLFTI